MGSGLPRIQGWITKPADFDPRKKYPLVLEINGGPFDNYGARFSSDNQLYAADGFVVLSTNPRGSSSYGEEFAALINHDYPGHDYDDLMSGVDAVIARGYVSPGCASLSYPWPSRLRLQFVELRRHGA